MSVQLQANKPLEKVVPHDFFGSALPTLLGVFLDRGFTVDGTVDFHIRGPHGGTWRLDGPRGTVRPRLAEERRADCALVMGSAEFEQMTLRPQETTAALREGRILVLGDPQRLASLAQLLAP